MSKVIEAKKQVVTEIAEKLRESQTTILVDYRGLTVSEEIGRASCRERV